MNTSIYWSVLIAFVALVLNYAESCQQCGNSGQCCDDGETCDGYGICRKILSDTFSDCGMSYCPTTSKCCQHWTCCPTGRSCCGMTCCDSGEHCENSFCESESTGAGFGWYYVILIAIPVVAICAGVCRYMKSAAQRNTFDRQQTHAPRRQGRATWNNDFVADRNRIAAASTVTHPYPGNTSSDRTYSSTASTRTLNDRVSDRTNTYTTPRGSDRAYSSSVATISDRTPVVPLTNPSAPPPSDRSYSSSGTTISDRLIVSDRTNTYTTPHRSDRAYSSSVATISDRTPVVPLTNPSAPPPSYDSISHATPLQPPSYNDVISGNVPDYK